MENNFELRPSIQTTLATDHPTLGKAGDRVTLSRATPNGQRARVGAMGNPWLELSAYALDDAQKKSIEEQAAKFAKPPARRTVSRDTNYERAV